MRIASLTIRGFRCFDEAGQTIDLADVTCLVGPNSSGKTAAILALARLFGDSRSLRQIVPSDFHLLPNEKLEDKPNRTLTIECRIDFPELLPGAPPASGNAIPETFNQMAISHPGSMPFCRAILSSTWTNDGTAQGDLEQELWWAPTDSTDQSEIDKVRHKVQPLDRARIRVIYVPAARDPAYQIRSTTETTFGRLLDAINWDASAEGSINTKISEIKTSLSSLLGLQSIESRTQQNWSNLYHGKRLGTLNLEIVTQEARQLIKQVTATFSPGDTARPVTHLGLSDGHRSLFSLSLVMGLFLVERELKSNPTALGFKDEVKEWIPLLSVFAVEEPENHLSPHYLGRVITQLKEVATGNDAQAILSSHSPPIVGRVMPDHVRYFLGHENSPATRVFNIPLPGKSDEEVFKFVREAVRGYPELYFSRMVILGEGPSEEIVLRRFFEVHGHPTDTNFISIVPLGGRHVNHFWRLLNALNIPYLTLLDLDREKEGAGWGRIQYIRDQLVALHGNGSAKLSFKLADGSQVSLDMPQYDTLSKGDVTDVKSITCWLSYFENCHDIFLSYPLDLDFSMLKSFPKAYQSLAPTGGGPRLPKPADAAAYQDAIQRRVAHVLAPNEDEPAKIAQVGTTYTPEEKDLFPWYQYLFVDDSKPTNHMRALIQIPEKELKSDGPVELIRLVNRAMKLLNAV